MRLVSAVTLCTLIMAAHASPTAEAEPVALAETAAEPAVFPGLKGRANLEKRKCTYNGCKCNSRGQQLLVCGNCVWSDGAGYIVTTKRVITDIFECAPDGKCCTYGPADDCGSKSARCKVDK